MKIRLVVAGLVLLSLTLASLGVGAASIDLGAADGWLLGSSEAAVVQGGAEPVTLPGVGSKRTQPTPPKYMERWPWPRAWRPERATASDSSGSSSTCS